MKRVFRDTPAGVTPKRFMRTLSLAIEYVDPSEEKLKEWLESKNQSRVIDEICSLIESKVDSATWKNSQIILRNIMEVYYGSY